MGPLGPETYNVPQIADEQEHFLLICKKLDNTLGFP